MAQNPWGHPQASRLFPPATDGTVKRGKLKLKAPIKWGMGLPKILSFGEVKISTCMQKKPHNDLTGHPTLDSLSKSPVSVLSTSTKSSAHYTEDHSNGCALVFFTK
jgi:hypothetical protein